MKRILTIIMLAVLAALSAIPAWPQSAREATIQPETAARLVLQSQISSKLNEVGDTVTAILQEPLYIDGQLVLSRGAEFHGRITEIAAAKRGMKGAQLTLVFDRVAMPWGEEPVAILLTAIDDWGRDQKLKADKEGKVKGGHGGDQTVTNVERGGRIGSYGALGTVLIGGAAGGGPGVLGAAGGVLAGGLVGGLLLSKGGEVRLNPGTVFRVKFVKPLTLPVIQQPGSSPRPIQQDDPPKTQDPPSGNN